MWRELHYALGKSRDLQGELAKYNPPAIYGGTGNGADDAPRRPETQQSQAVDDAPGDQSGGTSGFFFSNMGKDDYKTEDLPRSFTSLKTLFAGVDGGGRLIVFWVRGAVVLSKKGFARRENEDIRLEFRAVPVGKGYSLEFAAFDHKTGKLLDRLPLDDDGGHPVELPKPIDGEFPAEALNGCVAVAALSPSKIEGGKPRTPVRYWYRDFKLSGKDVETHAERRHGPAKSSDSRCLDDVISARMNRPGF